jgi:lipopolysaccharide biosynthesis regulator YciM
MGDGTKYDGKPGTHVDVEDHHAAAIDRSQHRGIGLLSSTRSYRLATRAGRRCPACCFSAQAWTMTCPRCGDFTEEDNER